MKKLISLMLVMGLMSFSAFASDETECLEKGEGFKWDKSESECIKVVAGIGQVRVPVRCKLAFVHGWLRQQNVSL